MISKACRLGATPLPDGRCRFRVWAPLRERVAVRRIAPAPGVFPLTRDVWGYHQGILENTLPGADYLYVLDGGEERPDPASRWQPRGVHGPSRVTDDAFAWTDGAWRGLPLRRLVMYELHVGTFTPSGTLDAAVGELDRLADLGITAIEIMPVAQFPGTRNWGYDGVYPFAVQDSYGGLPAFKRFVDACHARGLAVFLDVVYNHLGPEGNYLARFGPYFTDEHRTPWGSAVNFDGPDSDGVRDYFIQNALGWLGECHLDGLRLDAVNAIYDYSARPFLVELSAAVDRAAEDAGRRVHLIAETHHNDPRLVISRDRNGQGLDAVWNDDFHHSVHVLMTGEREGYYAAFGGLAFLRRSLSDGFAYAGQYSPYFRRRHGADSRAIPAERFVNCLQNHDQIGNRMHGERLAVLVPPNRLRTALALLLLSPCIPLLFMGEEYGEIAPFPYFVSHGDPNLVEAVRAGRREEFSRFSWAGEPPDPQDEAVFASARIRPDLARDGEHAARSAYVTYLLDLRRKIASLAEPDKNRQEVLMDETAGWLMQRRWVDDAETLAVYRFPGAGGGLRIPAPAGTWERLLDSEAVTWGGAGGNTPERLDSPGVVELDPPVWSAALYKRAAEVT